MTNVVTVRLDEKESEQLKAAVEKTKRTQSSILRECLDVQLPVLIGTKKAQAAKLQKPLVRAK